MVPWLALAVRSSAVEVPVAHQVRLRPGESRVHVRGDFANGARDIPDAHLVDLASERHRWVQRGVGADDNLVRGVHQRAWASWPGGGENPVNVQSGLRTVPDASDVVPHVIVQHLPAKRARRARAVGKCEELDVAVRAGQIQNP